MALLPFYIPGKKHIKVAIIGGGYAGMSALTVLRRYASDINITVIDPQDNHLKITHLHETFRYPLSDLQVPFDNLATRFNFRHIQAFLTVTESLLQQWQKHRYLMVNDERIDFDYLIVTVSADSRQDTAENVLTLQNFIQTDGATLLSESLNDVKHEKPVISVVGAGATGIQFLFEIKQYLSRQKISAMLQLIHSGNRVLERFPSDFGTYVQNRMQDLQIDFIANTRFHKYSDGQIQLEDRQTNRQYELSSHITLLFPGKRQEALWQVNSFGQVVVNHKTLTHIFAAGDCSIYNAIGSNAQTAQSAVRKGKLVGRNLLRHSGMFALLEPYIHHDIGYVIHLGTSDAVGWLLAKGNTVTGIPALAIKELVEAQYDLLLKGIDTYVI